MMRFSLLLLACLTLALMSAGEADALDNAIGIHQVDTIWDFGYTGEGISIAVLDTGIDSNHMSLNDLDDDPTTNDPKVIAFYDALDDSGDDGSGDTQAYDDHGHGSHVAGIIAGTGASDEGPMNTGEKPYRGVAPGATLVGVKVLDGGGSGSFAEVMRGMEWTLENRVKYNIRVAYIGPIGEEFTQEQEERITNQANEMVANGICVVIPAGNSAAYGNIDTLGTAKDVITVGATEDSRELAVYSSKGPTYEGQIKPNVVAIGSAVMSVEANSDNAYVSMSGTSMSAAIVAGISALVAESNPDLSPDEIRIILESTSEYRWLSYPVRPNNDYGWGFVNAADALDYAISFSRSTIVPSHSTQGPIDTVNYTKSETEGWNLTSSRYQVVVGTGIYFDLLNTDELVVCDLEIDFSEIVEGSDYCEENPYFFFEPGNFSFIVRMLVNGANESYNGPTLPFYLHINVVAQYLDYSIYRNIQDQGSSEGLSSVHGTIIDVNGNALEGVKIEADGKTKYTNAQGRYYLYDLIGDEIQITFTMEGYGDVIVWINIRSEGTNILEVELEEGGINKSIDRRNRVEICNTAEINFTAVNNGNFEDTAKVRISNLQELEDAGFLLALPAVQYQIESNGEQLIRVLVDSTGVSNIEIDYPLTLNVSTTLQGWDASAETTTTMKVVECQGDNEEESEENETIFPGKPTAIAGQDVSISPGGTIQFSGAGTDEDGSITKYEWDFDGDGVYEWSSTENGLTTFIFNNAGTYTATLRVTDDSGKTATDSLTVTVKSPEVEEESRLPSLSLAASLASLAVMALRRRPE